MERITIRNNSEFLRKVSTPVDFEKDDYLSCIELLKKFCRNNKV